MLYGSNQAPRYWHDYLVTRLKNLGVEQNLADVCAFRLVEAVSVSMNNVFAVGHKERCGRCFKDLYVVVYINNLGELRWYAGCHYSRDKVTG